MHNDRGVRPAAPKRATLRWKKHKRPTGLAAVGAGPQGSTLHDGTTEYATVYPLGGDWRRPLQGWYWTCGAQECGEYRNTCNEPAPDEQTAKAQAMRFVKAAIAKRAERDLGITTMPSTSHQLPHADTSLEDVDTRDETDQAEGE